MRLKIPAKIVGLMMVFVLTLLLFSSLAVFADGPLWQESFETPGGYTTTELCSDGSSDFFTRTNGTDIASWYEVTGQNGDYFFAAQDTNGTPECTLATQVITFNAVNVTGASNLVFTGLFAEDDSSDGNEDWDDTSLVYLEYQMDNGNWTKILQFASSASGYNSEPGLDTNLDGVADGTKLSPTFTDFSAKIGETGNSLVLRLTVEALDDGDEDIAFDNFRVEDVLEPNVALSKSVYPMMDIDNGDPVTYTILMANTGKISDTNATFTDTLPSDVDFAGWILQPAGVVENNDQITWQGDLLASSVVTVTFMVTNHNGYGQPVVNTANYEGFQSLEATATYTEAVVTDLSVTKDGPKTAVSGQPLVYDITVEVTGTQTATNAVFVDTLPVSTTYHSDNSGVTPVMVSSGVYSWPLGDLAPGASLSVQLTATLDSGVVSGTPITNTAMVHTDSAGDNPVNNTATAVGTAITISTISNVRAANSGEMLALEGQVTVVPGTFDGGNSEWVLQDDTGGIAIYNYGSPDMNLGDHVRLYGKRGSYNEQEQMTNLVDIVKLGPGTPVAPVMTSTYDVDSGDTEGWLVQVTGEIDGLDSCPGDTSFTVDDGSGAVAVYIDRDTGIDVCAAGAGNGDEVTVIGFSTQYKTTYQIKPRSQQDIVLSLAPPTLTKTGPAQVQTGEPYTYTLTMRHRLGTTLTNVVITDVIPAGVNLVNVLDGGQQLGTANFPPAGMISWMVGDVPNGQTVDVSFVVSATTNGSQVLNDNYAMVASNYVTPTTGAAVKTYVGRMGIYDVQGEGTSSPFDGQTVTVQGVVYADLQESGQLNGFFIQDPVGDGNAKTSDGIFVYNTSYTVNPGDWIELSGEVDEYNQQTQLTNLTSLTVISNGNVISTTTVTLPEQTNGDLEMYEGMYVTFPHTFTVQQNYFQGRYGQVTIAAGDGRLMQPTNQYAPGSAEAIALANENARRLLVLDDGSGSQNPNPIPYIGDQNTLRAGDVIAANLTGALDEGLINSSSGKDYRLQPLSSVDITRVNARTATPNVSGDLKIASFNVLNYFNGDGQGSGFPTSRGADTYDEFLRQRAKITSAILALDADIVGLMEIENDGYAQYSAIDDLVTALNGSAPAGVTYAYVDPGIAKIGTDEIAVGLIYNTETVTASGSAAILDSSVDSDFNDNYNRPALAQTFVQKSDGETLTVVVNHFKSKGSDCDTLGDPDTGDGQGNCNLTRLSAAQAQADWLKTDPTGSNDPDFLVIGDLNSYAMEDPIIAILNSHYNNLIKQFMGMTAYSYVFDGLAGYLDHALSSATLTPQVVDAAEWHINADEPSIIDYNTEYKSQDLYEVSPYRASDHDPVLIGLNLFQAGDDGVVADPLTDTQIYVPDSGGITTTVQIPSGAVSETVNMIYTEIITNDNLANPPANFLFAGQSFALQAYHGGQLQPGYVFSSPITIVLNYNPANLGDIAESTLKLQYWDTNSNAWSSAGISCGTPTNGTLTCTVSHLTQFGLFGQTAVSYQFVYHDLEDIIKVGDSLFIAGSFNGWNNDANQLTGDAGATVFTTTLSLDPATYQYKYVVDDGAKQWDWLNTGDRSVEISGTVTRSDDYRNVSAGWAKLDGPATQDLVITQSTDPISGQVYIQNVTGVDALTPTVVAEVGYGQSTDFSTWAWFPMQYLDKTGNNNIYSGVMTTSMSLATGTYSYVVRYTGNWGSDGTDNPNLTWAYADLDGSVSPSDFSWDQVGVMTVTSYNIYLPLVQK